MVYPPADAVRRPKERKHSWDRTCPQASLVRFAGAPDRRQPVKRANKPRSTQCSRGLPCGASSGLKERRRWRTPSTTGGGEPSRLLEFKVDLRLSPARASWAGFVPGVTANYQRHPWDVRGEIATRTFATSLPNGNSRNQRFTASSVPICAQSCTRMFQEFAYQRRIPWAKAK